MLSPYNDSEVAERTSTVHFNGYLPYSGQSVTLQAERVSDGAWTDITPGTSATSTMSATPIKGTNLYAWDAGNLPVPLWAWRNGVLGAEARVRGLWGSSDAVLDTFDVSPIEVLDCVNASGDWFDVRDNCTSEETGVVTIRTEDFVEFEVPDIDPSEVVQCESISPLQVSCYYDLLGSRVGPITYSHTMVRVHLANGETIDVMSGCLEDGVAVNAVPGASAVSDGCQTTTSQPAATCQAGLLWTGGETNVVCVPVGDPDPYL